MVSGLTEESPSRASEALTFTLPRQDALLIAVTVAAMNARTARTATSHKLSCIPGNRCHQGIAGGGLTGTGASMRGVMTGCPSSLAGTVSGAEAGKVPLVAKLLVPSASLSAAFTVSAASKEPESLILATASMVAVELASRLAISQGIAVQAPEMSVNARLGAVATTCT